jgi:hypothetical protein
MAEERVHRRLGGILAADVVGYSALMEADACRVHHFGPPDVISFEDVARPHPGEGEVLVRVKAAGVGPWDAGIRAGKSVLHSSVDSGVRSVRHCRSHRPGGDGTKARH